MCGREEPGPPGVACAGQVPDLACAVLGTTEVVFHNNSYKVISQMVTEREIDNRGSKSKNDGLLVSF